MPFSRAAAITVSSGLAIALLVWLATGDGQNEGMVRTSELPPENPIPHQDSDNELAEALPLRKRSAVESARNTAVTTEYFRSIAGSDVDSALLASFLADRPIGVYRLLSVNSNALREVMRDNHGNANFDFPLFNGEVVTLVSKSAEEHSAGWKTGMAMWLGSVEGYVDSFAQFLITPDGSIDGSIVTPEHGRVSIEAIKGTDSHVLWSWKKGYKKRLD